jgi:hypothetical protein
VEQRFPTKKEKKNEKKFWLEGVHDLLVKQNRKPPRTVGATPNNDHKDQWRKQTA